MIIEINTESGENQTRTSFRTAHSQNGSALKCMRCMCVCVPLRGFFFVVQRNSLSIEIELIVYMDTERFKSKKREEKNIERKRIKRHLSAEQKEKKNCMNNGQIY